MPDDFDPARIPADRTVPARTELFPHIGGPFDGDNVAVQVDEDGVPVEFSTIDDFTAPNMKINPAMGIQAQSVVHLYERDDQPGSDRGWVFRYRGSDNIDHNVGHGKAA